MVYIILSILSATGIFVVFKLLDKKQLPASGVITVNYLVAYLLGFLVMPKCPIDAVGEPWFIMAFLIGFLFVIFFFVIGLSSKYAGMTITSVAGKMSVVIPIFFSILYYQEKVNPTKIWGVALALLGVFWAIYGRKAYRATQGGVKKVLLPIFLFVGMGMVDSLVKYTQGSLGVGQDVNPFFTSVLFLIAFFWGVLFMVLSKSLKKTVQNPSIYPYGLALGLFNYGSIYFFISALNTNVFDSSIIFGINNVSIVILSVLLGVWMFKEKMSRLNYIGITFSVLSILLLSLS